MNRGIYTAATGMNACQTWLDVVANNLANASTTGYKRDEIVFDDVLVREMAREGGVGAPAGGMPSGMAPTATQTIFTVGDLTATDNPLDVAITTDRGLFGVQDAGGQRFFTRSGSFMLGPRSELVTRDGYLVLDGQGRPIQLPPDAQKIAVNHHGTVTADDTVVAQIGVFDGRFIKYGNQLYHGTDVRAIPPTLTPNSLESSNVNLVESMVQMISLQRTFEMGQRAIQNQDESNAQLIQALR